MRALWLPLLALAPLLLGADRLDELRDPDPRRRVLAYRDLGEVGDARAAMDRIAAALATEDEPEVRAAARDAMARLPLEQEDLIALLTGSDYVVSRAWAAWALGRYRSPAATEALLAAAGDPSEDVRREVYGALGRIGDRAALPALSRAAVREPSATLRARAEQAALDIASGRGRGLDVPTELALLEGGAPEDRVRAARVLGESGDWRALGPLLAAARSGSPELRAAALLALGHLGNHRAVQPLTELAASTSGELRYHAVAALANLGDPAAVPALEAMLSDPDPTARQLAIRALGWIGAPGTAERAASLLGDPAEEVRIEAVLALGASREPERLQALERAAADPSPFVRAEAARFLGESGEAAVAQVLIDLLEDRDALVRLSAADGLVSLGAVEALPALERAADRARGDEQRAHIEAAVRALGGSP